MCSGVKSAEVVRHLEPDHVHTLDSVLLVNLLSNLFIRQFAKWPSLVRQSDTWGFLVVPVDGGVSNP